MKPITPYSLGKAGLIALQADQRFSYALYVPGAFDLANDNVQEFDVVIAVHGSNRIVTEYRDAFVEMADRRGCFVLAPLFPIGIIDHYDADNYKYIGYRGIRYDLLLLSMLAEVEQFYGVRWKRKVIHGFSGGGQFVHRFMYLHPRVLTAASVGGPGKVTMLDDRRPWWVGTSDVEERFGIRINMDALRALRILLVVGEQDVDEDEIRVDLRTRNWMDGANAAGKNRVERIKALHANLSSNGIYNKLAVVPAAAHEDFKMIPEVVKFFEDALS
jgi:poly(3-hydroxybutyrate) depolymerase